MPITRKKKEEISEKMDVGFSKSKSIVFVNFKGITVAEVTEMRKALREHAVSYAVAKKTLTKRVLDNQKYKGELPSLEGELSVAYGEDLLIPAREVFEFEKKFKGKLSILGGVFDGEYKDAEAMKQIAMIPSREVLLSQIAFLLKSPLQRLAIAVSEVAKKK
jgi:large subunit ribosomal protein L10